MSSLPTIVITIKGLVEVSHTITEFKKAGKIKIKSYVARHTDPFVKKKSASLTVSSTEDIAASINKVDNRLAEKINAYYREALPIPETLAALYDGKLISDDAEEYPHAPWHYICPVPWRTKGTRELRLKYFRKHFLEFLSEAVKNGAYGPTVDEEIRNHILE